MFVSVDSPIITFTITIYVYNEWTQCAGKFLDFFYSLVQSCTLEVFDGIGIEKSTKNCYLSQIAKNDLRKNIVSIYSLRKIKVQHSREVFAQFFSENSKALKYFSELSIRSPKQTKKAILSVESGILKLLPNFLWSTNSVDSQKVLFRPSS